MSCISSKNRHAVLDNDTEIDGGFDANCAIYVRSKSHKVTEFGYTLGYDRDSERKLSETTMTKSTELIDSASGKINVYRVK